MLNSCWLVNRVACTPAGYANHFAIGAFMEKVSGRSSCAVVQVGLSWLRAH